MADRPQTASPDWGRRGTAGASIASSLQLSGVAHSYGDNLALEHIDLEIAPREIVCLLGRSGCGKSTLLRVAAGLERPQAGTVAIDGVGMTGPGVHVPPERRGIGFVFQDYALFPHMTILKNVTFGLTRLPAAEAREAALAALARVGLERYAEKYPHELSGGEQQRTALARAIAPRPGILLMDEPFSGLDRRLRDEVRSETLAILRETRATSIIVTHDPEEAMQLADRIVLMRGGRIAQTGTARELYHHPADIEVARFFSEINLIQGVGTDTGVRTALGIVGHQGARAGASYHVGIRPHGLVVAPSNGAPIQPVGRITGRRFIGEIDYVELAVEGVELPLVARSRLADDLQRGSDVSVTIDPRGILVFDA